MSSVKDQALQILQQLIRIRTPQPVGDELDAVKYIVSLLPKECFENRILYHGNNRATLVSELRGRGERNKTAIVGNLDTVGLEDVSTWQHPPFAADYEEGRVFGRGAVNNKGGVAAILLAALSLAASDLPPPGDVAFCFTADNDKGAIGATALIESGFFEDVGEIVFAQPTNLAIGIGQKGLLWLDIAIAGRAAHVTTPSIGVNALAAFVRLHSEIRGLFYEDTEHPLLGSPLANVTRVTAEGPTSYSIPDRAVGRVDIRFPPQVDADVLVEEIEALARTMMYETEHLRIDIDVVNKRAAMGMSLTAPIIRSMKRIYRALKLPPKLVGLPYFTDASVIVPRLGVPFVIVGPGEDIYGKRGEESIALECVVRAAEVYRMFLMGG